MHTEHRHHSHHHDCAGQSHGHSPEMFFGYCHDSGRMRMMNYPDYVSNVQTGFSNMYQNPASLMQPMIDAVTNAPRGSYGASHSHHGCGCEHCGHDEHDCSCECCIRCADLVEYARCGEVRRIPITFENDSRRERHVKLQLGAFAAESGQEAGWQAEVSEAEFTLPPCGEKTIILTVTVDCGKLGVSQKGDERKPLKLDCCKVSYATLRAEGCTIRPIVIAVAVLPDHCGAHRTGCSCGCCCN